MNQGYIKLYRKTLDSRVFGNPGLLKIWIWCLLKANHKGQWVSVKTGKGTTEVWIESGQFIFGRVTAAKKLKMHPETVRKRIHKLKNMGNLTIQSTKQYSIITIANWAFYQGDNKKVPSKVPGKYQPSTTNKNDKNEKKDIYCQNSNEFRLSELLLSLILERRNTFKKPDLQKWAKHIDLMARIDKREPEEIEKIIKWCQANAFWQNNILSTAKLRKQYDQLALKMEEEKNEGSRPKRFDEEDW